MPPQDKTGRGGISPVPRLALRLGECAAACGMSEDAFAKYCSPYLRIVRLGRLKLVSVKELERFLEEQSEHVFDGVTA